MFQQRSENPPKCIKYQTVPRQSTKSETVPCSPLHILPSNGPLVVYWMTEKNLMIGLTGTEEHFHPQSIYTANEGPVRIQFKCLVPIYVFSVMTPLVSKQNHNVMSPSSYTHISARDLYISRIGLPILLQENMWTVPGNTVYKSLTDT
jgi:hypothetical protein